MKHLDQVAPAKLKALGAAAQLLAVQRGGWASEAMLSAPQMREKWQTFAAKSSELNPGTRDNYGGGSIAGEGTRLRSFHRDAPPPCLAECDPAFMQALKYDHPGERDLCRELLGEGRPLAEVGPDRPTLRPSTEKLGPRTRAAHFAEEAKRHVPTMVAKENSFFRAAAAQKAVEIALASPGRPRHNGGTRPAWRDIYAQAIRYIATHSPSPVCDQAGRCEPGLNYRRGTAVPGSFIFWDEHAGEERRLATQIMKIEDSLPAARTGQHAVAKMWFQNQEWFVKETGEDFQLRGETIHKQCVIRALACAGLPKGGMLSNVKTLDKVANKAYEAIKREGDQCWAVFARTPTTARCNFLQARESAFDLAHFRDNNISLPMYFGTDLWRYVRFIIIKVDRADHVAMDVIDGVEFSVHNPRASVSVVLLHEHHLRPAYRAAGALTPRESETFIIEAETRRPHKPSIPVSRLRAVGWRQLAMYPDTSVWAYGRDLGQDEITGDRVRLAGLGAPDAAGALKTAGGANTRPSGGGRDRAMFGDDPRGRAGGRYRSGAIRAAVARGDNGPTHSDNLSRDAAELVRNEGRGALKNGDAARHGVLVVVR